MPPSTHKKKDSPQNVATPQWIVDKWSEHFLFLETDLAACKENAKCPKYYTKEDDSFTKDWHKDGPCWLNPEYKKLAPWLEKCYDEALLGATIVMLVPFVLHRNYAEKFMRDGPCASIPFGPAIQFEGYPNASSMPHMFIVWNKGLTGELYWLNLKDDSLFSKICGEIKARLV